MQELRQAEEPDDAPVTPSAAVHIRTRGETFLNVGGWTAIFGAACVLLYLAYLVLGKVLSAGELGEIDPDEGFNAMKSLLSNRGLPLYQQIWSDQPPFFSLLLAGWFSLFGATLTAGRILVVLFSLGAIASLYNILLMQRGQFAAIAGTILAALSSHYLFYSSALMIGIPALAFGLAASLALIAAYYQRERRTQLVFISALFYALGAMTKLTVITLLPAIILELYLMSDQRKRSRSARRMSPMFVWCSVTVIATVMLILVFAPELFTSGSHSLFATHLDARENWMRSVDPKRLKNFLSLDLGVKILALIGVAGGLIRIRREVLFPVSWLLCSAVVTYHHHPLWDHHYLLIGLPVAWLAAFGLDEVRLVISGNRNEKLEGFNRRAGLAAFVILCAVAVRGPFLRAAAEVRREPVRFDSAIVTRLKDETPPGSWVVTDRPLYAFAAGQMVPPALVVASKKRFKTGELSNDDYKTAIEYFRPTFVLLARFDALAKALNSSLKERYDLIENRRTLADDQKRSQLWRLKANNVMSGEAEITPGAASGSETGGVHDSF